MPKILIRESDLSKVSVYGEDNFSVLVPGYVNPSIYKQDISSIEALSLLEVGKGVYRFNKVSDFEKLIGCYEFEDSREVPAKAGTYSHPSLSTDAAEGALATIDNYGFHASMGEVLDSLQSSYYKLYFYTEDESGVVGRDYFTIEQADESVKVYKISPISEAFETDMTEIFTVDEDGVAYTTSKVVKIENKALGTDPVAAVEERVAKHIGNQIAFELLNLGYTVLYKVMDNSKGVDQLNDDTFWEDLADRSVYSFRYILTGLKGKHASSLIMNKICKLASSAGYDEDELGKVENAETVDETRGRGDCIALCDINESYLEGASKDSEIARKIIESAAAISDTDKYSAIFGPQVIYASVNQPALSAEVFKGYKNTTFPASFHYLACAAHAQKTYREWYAVAGYTRGVSTLPIKATTYAIGDRIINTVAPRISGYTNKSINLILKERNNYYLWGNRTAEALNPNGLKFSHFLNIRQLCTTIKQHVYTACRKYMFDSNSDLLWINFVNTIKPLLETMKADQGISGYKIVKVANNKKALMTASIKIVPIEAIEDFDIKIELNDSLTGLQATVEESAK